MMNILGVQELKTQESAIIGGGCWNCWEGVIGAIVAISAPTVQALQPIVGAYNAGYESHICK